MENPEMERMINRGLKRQIDMNVRVGSLLQDSDQSMDIHKKFKQLIGYQELKVNRNKSHKKKEIIHTPLILSPVRKSMMENSMDELSHATTS